MAGVWRTALTALLYFLAVCIILNVVLVIASSIIGITRRLRKRCQP